MTYYYLMNLFFLQHESTYTVGEGTEMIGVNEHD